ncbi:MAG TPA: YitT family protein [Firmicutes bacterium]|nr:YitT family protein [Bacillota bacterium]
MRRDIQAGQGARAGEGRGGAGRPAAPGGPAHKARRYLLDLAFTLLGSFSYALSVNVFTAPNHIAPGGVTGAATLVNYLTGAPIGITILVINIPLLAAAWRYIGHTYTLKTSVATVVVSLVIDVSAFFLPPFLGDTMLVAVFGGVLAGVGLGLIYMRGATTGGSEVVAGLLERRLPHIPIGRLILLVDAVVVAASALVYRNLESALYAMILIFVSSSLMDSLIYGRQKGKLLLIMTRREQEVADGILRRLGRGVTMLNAAGAYTGDARRVLLCAVRPPEVYELRTLVWDCDPEAFLIVASADEVLGEGFRRPGKRP